MIPDHARHCPHCRARQPGGQKLFQAVLVAVVAIAAALALWGVT